MKRGNDLRGLRPAADRPPATSSSLLVRLQARDAGAWERLVHLYGPFVYGTARRRGLQPADAGATASLYRRALGILQADFEEKTWQAFWRAAVEGQPAAAIAADLEMSAAAVRKAKSRVLRRLRTELAGLID